ncbi:MAG: hypothetical protein P1V35_08480, partial [Planctomycetota bacterium]|nr:hypothetical protein [Planctomycetota bacterium]
DPDDESLVGIAWLDDGRIVFGSFTSQGRTTLRSIPEAGGVATKIAQVSSNSLEGHFHGITPVPGGRFLAVLHSFVDNNYSILTEGDPGIRTLFSMPAGGEDRASVRWVPGDYMLYSRATDSGDETWAVRLAMDPFEVTGEPFFVQRGMVGMSTSKDGTLAYVDQGQGQKHQLAWWSPNGKTEPIGRVHDQRILTTHLASKQDSILYAVGNAPPLDLWRYDIRREISTELAAEGGVFITTLPDHRISIGMFQVKEKGAGFQSYLLPLTGRGEPEPWLTGAVICATETHALAMEMDGSDSDFFVHDLTSGERSDFRVGKSLPYTARISPDGKWALYTSSYESNPGEAFLTHFPSGEGEWQVSINGAMEAEFSPDGSEIHYVNKERELYRVALETDPEPILGPPQLIGQAEEGTTLYGPSEASSGRFLAMQELGSNDGDLVIVLGWASKLAGR